jgi:hypothetical protein
MIHFVLYTKPLIQAINSKVQGMVLQQTNVKSLAAYADDINFVVNSDEEIDRAFEAVELFCKECNGIINMRKSAFLRINNCKVGPQKIKELYSMKILGLVFETKVRDFIKTNYENLINTINYMHNQHCRRNMNLIQKIWFRTHMCY